MDEILLIWQRTTYLVLLPLGRSGSTQNQGKSARLFTGAEELKHIDRLQERDRYRLRAEGCAIVTAAGAPLRLTSLCSARRHHH